MMEKSVVEVGYDAKKLPLGKLSKDTIKKGYSILKELEKVILGKKKGNCDDLSSEFFRFIPHDFGFANMRNFTINTKEKLKAKLNLVEQLDDIEIAKRLLDETDNEDINELDSNYKKLKCKLVTLDKSHSEYKMVNEYLLNTHGATHGMKLELLDLFKVDKEGEKKRFKD